MITTIELTGEAYGNTYYEAYEDAINKIHNRGYKVLAMFNLYANDGIQYKYGEFFFCQWNYKAIVKKEN